MISYSAKDEPTWRKCPRLPKAAQIVDIDILAPEHPLRELLTVQVRYFPIEKSLEICMGPESLVEDCLKKQHHIEAS